MTKLLKVPCANVDDGCTSPLITYTVRDVWQRRDLGTVVVGRDAPHGTCLLVSASVGLSVSVSAAAAAFASASVSVSVSVTDCA